MRDPVGLSGLDFAVSYTPHPHVPADEQIHGYLSLNAWPWSLRATYNYADFYDLIGPTKVSRKGYSLGLEYSGFLLNDRPRTMEYIIGLSGWGGLETMPDYQNVDASFDKFASLRIQAHYKYFLRSLGAVEYERGIDWKLSHQTNYVNNTWYPRFYANLDYGFLLPLMHSSLWLRSALGYSIGDVNEPFANFYFGGFGNNWVDYQDVDRYRLYYTFPGVEINEVGGVNFGRLLVEWTLPPIRFRQFGIPSFYVRWARFAVFGSGIMTNADSKPDRRTLGTVGAQLNIRLVTFSLYKSTLSFGYAFAFEDLHKPSREFMVSLRIL